MKKLYRMCDKKGIRHPKWIVVHEYSTYVDGVWVGKHHHHVIMQRVYGLTREMVEEAWSGRGMARCEPLHFDNGYITSLAKYIMKNVRCKRHWRQSRGLKPPKMPRPNDGKMSRTKLKDVCENRLEDRAYGNVKLPAMHYTPDFVLTYADGTVEVVEVKSKFTRRQQRDYIHRRRMFIDLVAEPRGWRFVEHITPDTAAEIKAWKKCAQQDKRKG